MQVHFLDSFVILFEEFASLEHAAPFVLYDVSVEEFAIAANQSEAVSAPFVTGPDLDLVFPVSGFPKTRGNFRTLHKKTVYILHESFISDGIGELEVEDAFLRRLRADYLTGDAHAAAGAHTVFLLFCPLRKPLRQPDASIWIELCHRYHLTYPHFKGLWPCH